MENIYNLDVLERNSIVELPDGFSKKAGDTLYSWLGSLWRSIHLGDTMVRGMQAGRGIRLAQLYLDILEAAKLQDRNGMPVFHRELWHPIVIRLSDRDKSQENILSIGEDAVIGPQTDPESPYGQGTVLQMGKLANYKDFVTYPVGHNIKSMATTIVDNIVAPSVVLEFNKDFDFRKNSIIFRKEDDPLASNSKFEKYDVPGFDKDNPNNSDVETVLWASDVLVDKNYIADHLSYPLGARAESTDVIKRILNSAWSSISSGLTPELLRTLIAAMLNIPVIQESTEIVINLDENDSCKIVNTDKNSYKVSKKAKLISGIHSGSILHKGDLLDESLRIYAYLNKNLDSNTGFSVPIEQDIPSIVLSSDILSARTEYGIYSMWGETEVKRSKDSPTDKNGNPHLYFEIGGTDIDKSRFWDDVWKRAESKNQNMSDIIGEEGSMISPARFFVKNLIGANTIFIVVDASQIDDDSLLRDPMFFGMLNSVVPSAIRLFIVEHRQVVDDGIDLGDTQESTSLYAYLKDLVEHVREESLPGLKGQGASFGDRVNMRFVRPEPKKVRSRKEI